MALGQFAQRRAPLLHGTVVVLDIVIAKKTHAHKSSASVRCRHASIAFSRSVRAGVVFAVGHHEENLLLARAFFQVIRLIGGLR